MMNLIKVAVLIPMVSLNACQNTQALTNKSDLSSLDAPYIQLGQEITETHCAVCHTAGRIGASPRPDAPPLRTVLNNYNSEALADDFREHIHVGHPDMPDFDFSVKETEGLLSYLRSIQEVPE